MTPNKAATWAFLAGGGELGDLMRNKDWSNTSIGAPDQWTPSLRATVGVCLNAHTPALIWWGSGHVMLYNDAYRLILGDKHPKALGSEGRAVWPEIWATLGPRLKAVLTRGEADWSENELLLVNRRGLPEAAYFSCSHSPIYDESGGIGGVFCLATETTDSWLRRRQRQELEEAGRKKELSLATLFEQVTVGVAILGLDPAFTVELATPFYHQVVGRPANQLVGKPLLEALPELAGQGFEGRLKQVTTTGVAYKSGETPVHLMRRGQLETSYVDFVYQPRYETNKSITGVIIIVTDITPAVRARQRLESNERLLSAIIQQTPLGVGIFSGPEFTVEMANPTICQLWGRTHQQVIDKPLFTVLPEATGQGFEELLQGVYKTGFAFEGHELPVTLERNGQLKTVYFNFVYDALRNVEGGIERTMVIATEVTRARQDRQQTEVSEARLRSLFQQAPVAIAIMRGPTFVVELANPLICTLWNRTQAQLLGNPIFGVLTESAGHGFEELLTGVLHTGVPFVGHELPVPFQRDGQVQPVYVNFVYEPLRDRPDGPISGIVVVGTDVTEQVLIRQQTERLLVQERELNELKSNFVTLASHEFRTPMGTILSSASLIGRYNGPDEDDKRERHVQRIKSAVHGLTGLLNDFLSLSQMEQSTLHGCPQPLHIVTFCQEVIDDMQALIKPGQRIVYTHLSGEPAVSLDGQMLKNILINLLVNASKYSANGKAIDLSTAVAGDQFQLTVRDQGIGIPDADKDKLFINFFRARNVNHVSGTGLGLYVVKRYVDLLGGTVSFTSQLDSGTIFTVHLPLTPPSHENHSGD
ncbi:PAS domain-containing protein [Spirosoma oryzicola]|uniref:sensor histidine kinase n=1 Tax=Spirosoma oryzicola TaxID=2898794 RepID=UPI001E402B2E|nr:PAS domain-containing protein [Spirosoma oryzicola]UHG94543.1 PAS domain-containing sensor histidine kinase [Spirosoma oryzicola]